MHRTWLRYAVSLSSLATAAFSRPTSAALILSWPPLPSARGLPARRSVTRQPGQARCSQSSMTARDTRGDGMAGVLFQFKSQSVNLQAFESGPELAARKLLVLGGLSDGMLPCPWVPQLATALSHQGWSVVQANLRSSYQQWGFGSLDEDVEDVTSLIEHLVRHRSADSLAICGHSTGSQIIAHLMRTRPHPRVSHVILQGGVSDRETDDQDEQSTRGENLALAAKIAAESPAGGREMMPRNTTWAPITAQRYLDLNAKAGADDYFSSDLTDDELRERFTGCYDSTQVLIAYSAEDEYVPKSVNKEALLRRLASAMRGQCDRTERATGHRIVPLLVTGGCHALYAEEAADQFIDAAVAFLNDLPVAKSLDLS